MPGYRSTATRGFGGGLQGREVAVDLTRIFSDVWGEFGRYLLLTAIVIALGGSILANQDGWGRSFADMTLILTRVSATKRALARCLKAWMR